MGNSVSVGNCSSAIHAVPPNEAVVVCGSQGPPGISATEGVRLTRNVLQGVVTDIDNVSRSLVVSTEWTIVLLDNANGIYKRLIVTALVGDNAPTHMIYGIIGTGTIPIKITTVFIGTTLVLRIENLHDQDLVANVSRIDLNRVL